MLLGVTGSGKTFTVANVVARVDRPTLVLAHNKTLAAQLYQEFKRLFPQNAVEYFVSYYDYYQPEAYVPQSDTYIEKESTINEEIDRMRHSATRALFERRDVVIVASVSCIYGLGSPEAYHGMMLLLETRHADRPRRRPAQAGGDPVPADQRRPGARHVPRPGGHGGDLALLRRGCAPPGVLGGRGGGHLAPGPRAGQDGGEPAAAPRLPQLALRHPARDAAARPSRPSRRSSTSARRSWTRSGKAAGGAAPPPADGLRSGDAARGRLLPRDRELLAPPDGPRAGRGAAHADGLPARRTRC